MQELRIATAQFESRDGDKQYNLGRIEALTRQAAAQGAKLVLFHELCITGYTWLERLTRDEIAHLAEPWPGSPSVTRLVEIARVCRWLPRLARQNAHRATRCDLVPRIALVWM